MFAHVILHIPHSGLDIPPGYIEGENSLVSGDTLRRNVFKEADLFVDQLFPSQYNITTINPLFSRIVCDVERFRDDVNEPESQRGRGLFYTHFEDGTSFRAYDVLLRQKTLAALYDPHHALLTKSVAHKLQRHGQCCIIDCHSFSNMLSYGGDLPDFCIGTDSFHTSKFLMESLQTYIERAGYSVKIDFPYSGSIVPMSYYKREPHVQSIMIEVNKRLYLDEATFSKTGGFAAIREFCRELVGLIATLSRADT